MERRRFIRIIEGSPVSFLTSDGVRGEGKLVDLSLRGMRFNSRTEIPDACRVRSIFLLENGLSMDLAGVVRHASRASARRWVYGVEFFIQDYRDLKEHLKLNDYIMRIRAEQDRLLREKLLKRK